MKISFIVSKMIIVKQLSSENILVIINMIVINVQTKKYVVMLVILSYFILINSVKPLTKPIKVKYDNITSVATYNGAHLHKQVKFVL